MTERYKMETIDGMLPFIVDEFTATKRSGDITSYHTYRTNRENKCLELVDLLNKYEDGVNSLKKQNECLKEELDYIKGLISYTIQHQKTELGKKSLQEVIREYNNWMLGHGSVEDG